MNILIIGGGSFGTALTYILDKNNNKCYLWEFNSEFREELRKNRENKNFLEGYKFSENVDVVDDFNEILKTKKIDIILLATPTQFIRKTLEKLDKNLLNGQIIVNVAKGLEIETEYTISKIVEEVLQGSSYTYVLLSGPTHAEEIIKDMPSAILAVSNNEESAKIVQKLFSNGNLRVYTGDDLIGAEIGGAVKNCLAICAGICDGLGYGDNTKAALLTRGIHEMEKIGKVYGANTKTFMGLTGIGDMIVTCTSKHSRNRYLGEQIGKGRKLQDISKEMKMIAEGAETIKALKRMIDENKIQSPIFEGLYNVMYENMDVKDLVKSFMQRSLKEEF